MAKNRFTHAFVTFFLDGVVSAPPLANSATNSFSFDFLFSFFGGVGSGTSSSSSFFLKLMGGRTATPPMGFYI